MRDIEVLEAIAAPNSEAHVYAYMAYFRQGATHEDRERQSWDGAPSWLWKPAAGRRRVTGALGRLKAAGLVELEPVRRPEAKTKRPWRLTDAGRKWMDARTK